MNQKTYDDFADVTSGEIGLSEGGILDSAGLRDYDGIQTAVIKEGAGNVMNCRLCNKKRRIDVEWPELIMLAENKPGQVPILPNGWKVSEVNKTAYTTLQCPACGQMGFHVHMTPGEAYQHVQAGLASGLVPQQLVLGIQQQVAAMRGQRR